MVQVCPPHQENKPNKLKQSKYLQVAWKKKKPAAIKYYTNIYDSESALLEDFLPDNFCVLY